MKTSKNPFDTPAEFEQFRWQTAAKILAGMLSNPVFTKSTASTLPYEDEVLAGWAVGYTDALIEQLAGKEIPDAILEQPEVDLEKEIDACWQNWLSPLNQKEVEGVLPKIEFATYARHFYELGRNARKEE